MIGHRKLFLKSDNESSILALKRRARNECKEMEILPEESIPYDPQSNGGAGSAVKIMQEIVRVQLSQLAANFGKKIPLDHLCLTWLIQYCSSMYNLKFPIVGHGRTPYMRWRLRQFHGFLHSFGIGVYYRRSADKFATKFTRGIYLGKTMVQPYAHILADSELGALFTTRDIKLRDDKHNYDWGEFNAAIKQPPWGATPPKTAMTPTYADVTDKADTALAPARFKSCMIKEKYCIEFGFTPGCYGCKHIEDRNKPKSSHSQKSASALDIAVPYDPLVALQPAMAPVASAASAASSSSASAPARLSQSHSPPHPPTTTSHTTAATTMMTGKQTTRRDTLISTGGGVGNTTGDDVAMDDNTVTGGGGNARTDNDVDIATHGDDQMNVSQFTASQALILRLGLSNLHRQFTR
jgi:hypothetical protein